MPGRDLPANKSSNKLRVYSGKSYEYTDGSNRIEMEMRYLPRSDGNVEELLRLVGVGVQDPTTREKAGIGFYSLARHEHRAFLTTCINSAGVCTVTRKQCQRARDANASVLTRWFAWLPVVQARRDRRCLWALLSVPADPSSGDRDFEVLEKAWFSWFHLWTEAFRGK